MKSLFWVYIAFPVFVVFIITFTSLYECAGRISIPPARTNYDSVVVYFSFEKFKRNDILEDESGKNHHGKMNGAIEITDSRRGKAARFADLSFIELTNVIPPQRIPREEMTVCAWVNCTNTGDIHEIFNVETSTGTSIFRLELRNEGYYRWVVRTRSGETILDMRAGIVAWDTWVHVAGAYSATRKYGTLYINGFETARENIAGQTLTGDWTKGVRIGLTVNNDRPFTGFMDDFAIWNKALTADEIKRAMVSGPTAEKEAPVRPLEKTGSKPFTMIKGKVTFFGQRDFVGTKVQVVELKKKVLTNLNGDFSMQVPEGNYTLKITRDGFREKEIRVKAIGESTTELAPIRLTSQKASVRPKPDDSIFVGGNPFAVPKVHIVKFYFSGDAISTLRKQNDMNAPRTDVHGKMVINDEVFENVAVHIRGGLGSFRPIYDKPGLRVDLSKFVPSQKYHGLKELSFHNSVQDASYICEYIGYYMWRLAGIPAPDVTWAKVYINDKYKGLYYIKEVVNKDFLKRWFYNPNGNLYKAKTGPISDFNSGPAAWGLQTNKTKGDTSELAQVANVVSRTPSPQLMDVIWDYVDMDNYITNWAMEILTNHWDGYVQQSWNNNLYIYHDAISGKFYLIPHGVDQLFQGMGGPQLNTPVARTLYQNASFRKMLKAKRLEILQTVWDAEKLCAKIDEVRNVLRRDARNEINAGEGKVQEIKNHLRILPEVARNWP
jgi:hypothetical protein